MLAKFAFLMKNSQPDMTITIENYCYVSLSRSLKSESALILCYLHFSKNVHPKTIVNTSQK